MYFVILYSDNFFPIKQTNISKKGLFVVYYIDIILDIKHTRNNIYLSHNIDKIYSNILRNMKSDSISVINVEALNGNEESEEEFYQR